MGEAPSGPPRAPGGRWHWRVQPKGQGEGVFGGWVSCMVLLPQERKVGQFDVVGLGGGRPGPPGSLQIV